MPAARRRKPRPPKRRTPRTFVADYFGRATPPTLVVDNFPPPTNELWRGLPNTSPFTPRTYVADNFPPPDTGGYNHPDPGGRTYVADNFPPPDTGGYNHPYVADDFPWVPQTQMSATQQRLGNTVAQSLPLSRG
jgi:hypothetical protein